MKAYRVAAVNFPLRPWPTKEGPFSGLRWPRHLSAAGRRGTQRIHIAPFHRTVWYVLVTLNPRLDTEPR